MAHTNSDRRIPDVLELAQCLVRCRTTADGDEDAALQLLARLLTESGFSCTLDIYDAASTKRASLVARLRPGKHEASLLFAGHIDTVPFDAASWRHDPLSGRIADGLLYGRGACDMKSGVAAMVCAAIAMAPALKDRDIVVHIYGGEERGCLGSLHTAERREFFGNPGACIVTEPSDLTAQTGHKGALWLTLRVRGRAAHASMPEQGDNALIKMLAAISALKDFCPQATHETLGQCTTTLTSLHCGRNSNSVPDEAVLTVDMRTVPGQDHAALMAHLHALVGPDVEISVTYDGAAVWTDPCGDWCARARRMVADITKLDAGVTCAKFFTDAVAVRRVFPELPIIILGPGNPGAAHVTDESCPIAQIITAQRIYEALIADWYNLECKEQMP
jgi:succinyl-diaminopimelate desuccinylase